MSIQRLTERYGHTWITNPPVDAIPLILDGSITVPIKANLRNNQERVVLQIKARKQQLIVVQRLIPLYYQIDANSNYTTLHPAILTPQQVFFFRKNKKPASTQTTQYPNNDGYLDPPAAGPRTMHPVEGLSLALPVDLERSPLIIEEGKRVDLVLKTIDKDRGPAQPEGAQWIFFARLNCFWLHTY